MSYDECDNMKSVFDLFGNLGATLCPWFEFCCNDLFILFQTTDIKVLNIIFTHLIAY